jgi:hypothetical protein
VGIHCRNDDLFYPSSGFLCVLRASVVKNDAFIATENPQKKDRDLRGPYYFPFDLRSEGEDFI